MKNQGARIVVLTAAALTVMQMRAPSASAASAGIFPNDAGVETVDVSSYPADIQKGYRLMLIKCSACHKVSRPINAQYLELSEDEIKQTQTKQPAIFRNKLIWDIAPKSWSMKVHRMMIKPGNNIKREEGKQIYEFLVYDSKIRKTGSNAEAWRKNRAKLVQEFAKENPDVYKTLFAGVPPPAVDESISMKNDSITQGEKKK